MEETSLRIRRPDDFHLHLREKKMLYTVIRYSAEVFARAIIMPNLAEPVRTAKEVRQYRQSILEVLRYYGLNEKFTPLMTIQITDETTPADIAEAKRENVLAGKFYPKSAKREAKDVTSTSHGVTDFRKLTHVLEAMEKNQMHALFHAEPPDTYYTNREVAFLEILEWIRKDFPDLPMVVEHITTREAVYWVTDTPGVAATITLHHLLLTGDDVMGAEFQPHFFCKPLAKRPEDRNALRGAALSGNPKFFFGSDSAPWLRELKEGASCKAGVFTAPAAIPLLAEFFDSCRSLCRLEPFVSEFGARYYGLDLNLRTIRLVQREWALPDECDGVVPFCPPREGRQIHWSVE